MSLATLSRLIRLNPVAPVVARPDAAPVGSGDGRSLLAREARPARMALPPEGAAIGRQTLLVGLDFGVSRTRVAAVVPGVEGFYLRRSLASAVARLAAEDGKVISPYLHFGDEAVGKGARFETIHPWQGAEIADPAMARELARHVRELMRRSETTTCRAVVAEPVNLSTEGRHDLQQALRGLFEEVIFLPRPYLAALGLRQRIAPDAGQAAASQTALVVDLGAGSTEICRLGGRYPRTGDMAGVAFGGDQAAVLIRERLRQEYPSFQPGRTLIRGWLENFGFVGEASSTVVVKVPVDGVERQIVLTQSLRLGCETWLTHVQQLIAAQLGGDPADTESPALIYLTGGGSGMHRLVPVLTERLARSGISGLRIETVEPEADLSLAARGALHAAHRVRADQWPRFALD